VKLRIHYDKLEDLELLAKALARTDAWHEAIASERAWVEREYRIELETFRRQLADDLARYRSGGFRSRGQAEWWMKRHIRQAYLHAFIEGKIAAGGYRRMALRPDEEKWLLKQRRDEYKYLRKFLDDVDAGKGRMPYARRIRMYGDALNSVYWAGFASGNRDPRRTITWVAHPAAEHCETCMELDGRTWTAPAFQRWVQETGILPGQNTKCLTNCKCHLEDRFA